MHRCATTQRGLSAVITITPRVGQFRLERRETGTPSNIGSVEPFRVLVVIRPLRSNVATACEQVMSFDIVCAGTGVADKSAMSAIIVAGTILSTV
jgi:hypothetical protein